MTSIDNRPDVAAFVAEVRARLADLPTDERDELLDGLEADLADQLADGNATVGDPASYAAELRAAAGLPAPRARGWHPPAWPGGDVRRELDRLRGHWTALVEKQPLARQAWSVAQALRPAWWVLRAWIAVTLIDQLTGSLENITIVPHLGVAGLGLILLAVAVVISTLIGQNRLWPGSGPQRRLVSRLVLLMLNVVAVLAPLIFSHYPDTDYRQPTFAEPVSRGVVVDGRDIRNIYPYDAQGQPLTGVQLYDGAGRKIALSAEQTSSDYYGKPGRVVGCPWVNGTQRLFNVFPLPERAQRNGVCRAALDTKLGPGALPTPPLTQVPPVALPTVAP